MTLVFTHYRWHNQLKTKILPSDGSHRDLFGFDVSISEDYRAAVGAPLDDCEEIRDYFNTGLDCGAVYLYEKENVEEREILYDDYGDPYMEEFEIPRWHQFQKLVASDRQDSQNFGFSVSVYNDFVTNSQFRF